MQNIPQNILSTIGNTPLVQLANLFPEYQANIYAKLEAFNPGGSIKDRTANSILSDAIERGKINKETTVIESSSGNMAIGLAQCCLRYGLKLKVIVDPLINIQTVKILNAYGAEVVKVYEQENGSFLNARLAKVKQLLETTPNAFWPNQYANPSNPNAHFRTMQEIYEQLEGKVDYIFAATSTCGTLMGCANFLKANSPHTKIIAVDAKGSMIFKDKPSKRLIPGHGAGRPSQLLDETLVDHVVHISDKECVQGCHQLLNREAILAGGSSGAVVAALHKMLPNIPAKYNCAIILCDRGERYLETIYSEAWVKDKIGITEEFSKQSPVLFH